MKQEIESSAPQISLEKIKAFESDQGISLTERYRQFLAKWNGGEPVLPLFEVPDLNLESCVNSFFGIHDGEYDSLGGNLEIFADRLPAGFVPVADDPAGNLLCLGTRGEYENKVYFWDHEDELDDHGESRMDMSNMYWVADDIFELIEKLAADE